MPFFFVCTRHKISATIIQLILRPSPERNERLIHHVRPMRQHLHLRCCEPMPGPSRHRRCTQVPSSLGLAVRPCDVPDDALQFDHVLLGQLGMLNSSTQTDPEPCCAALPRIQTLRPQLGAQFHRGHPCEAHFSHRNSPMIFWILLFSEK